MLTHGTPYTVSGESSSILSNTALRLSQNFTSLLISLVTSKASLVSKSIRSE